MNPKTGTRRSGFNMWSITSWHIISLYAICGISWIIFSDLLVEQISITQSISTYLSIFKGCFFILVTSALLYVLLKFYRKNILESYRKIEQAESNYKHLFENNPVPMWLYDLDDFRFLMVNNAALQRYGYSKDEFLEMTIFDIRPEEDHLALQTNITSDPNSGYIFSGVWKHLKKNGEIIFVEIDSHSIIYRGRKAKLVMSIDVTELVHTQTEIKAVSEELNNFVYRASHDLRGPLARLIGLTDLIKSNGIENSNEYVEILSKTARLMDKMLQRLLTVNNLKEYTPSYKVISLKHLVDEIIADALQTNDINLPILNSIQDDLIFACDLKIIQLVLENLIDNAIKYRDPVKILSIELEAKASTNQVEIRVSDNGIGIDAQVKPRIFDLFFRGTELSKGSGLGLYIVQEAVKRQHGNIKLKADARYKTIFEVTLPINVI